MSLICAGECSLTIASATAIWMCLRLFRGFTLGLDLTRLSTGVFHPGLYGDNVCMFVIWILWHDMSSTGDTLWLVYLSAVICCLRLWLSFLYGDLYNLRLDRWWLCLFGSTFIFLCREYSVNSFLRKFMLLSSRSFQYLHFAWLNCSVTIQGILIRFELCPLC